MATKKNVIDIDKLIAASLSEAEAKERYVPVKLFGREWRISDQINTFISLRAGDGDAKAFTEFLANAPHPDEQHDFLAALYATKGLTAEILLSIVNHLFEAVAGNPTKSSSASSRSSATRAAPRKSAAT